MIKKVVIIDLRTPRQRVVKVFKNKNTYKIAGKFSLFVLATLFTGLCAVATDIHFGKGYINTERLMEENSDLFNNLSEKLKDVNNKY